jgi:hypothetical protein
VQQKIVQVEPLGPVRRSRKMAGERSVALDRLDMVLVVRTMELAPGRTDERRVQPVHRVVPLARGPQ